MSDALSFAEARDWHPEPAPDPAPDPPADTVVVALGLLHLIADAVGKDRSTVSRWLGDAKTKIFGNASPPGGRLRKP